LQTPCVGAKCSPGQLSAEAAGTLEQPFGLSLKAYAILSLALRLISALAWFLVAAVLVWRKPNDWLFFIFALQLVFNGAGHPDNALQASNPLWQEAALAVNVLYMVLLFLVLVLFPDGRFVPRWIGWVVLLASLLMGSPLSAVVFPIMLVLLLVAQGYRYWRVSRQVQRQQAKWIIFSAVIVFLWQLATNTLTHLSRSFSQPGALAQGAIQALTPLVFVLIPVSFGFAMLRYRLWDIDTIINRALVYSLLTALLAALYAGLIIGLEALAGVISGGGVSQQPVALVISTLAIAALFQPLRHRIQAAIDRRFYRKKYDAARTLAAFSATLRNEVDLQQVREQLLMVVQETMQPAHVSLWLRQSNQPPTEQAYRPEKPLA
jgi:hypothetical protein